MFSLTCAYCDAGMDVESEAQAIAEGWTDIAEDADGLSWNHVGVCPACQDEHNA